MKHYLEIAAAMVVAMYIANYGATVVPSLRSIIKGTATTTG